MELLTAARLVIVAGKGGVGKTTVTASLAVAAGRAGLDVLVIEVEGKSGLAGMLGVPGELGYDDVVLASGLGPGAAGRVRARTISPTRALVDYFEDHGLRRLSNRLAKQGLLDVVATAAPGIDDILVLGKVKQLERAAAAQLIILDAPAAGHAITFLQSARGLVDAVTVGPINAQATEVLAMLADPARTQVLLVTLPEETPVNELVDTAFALEDRVGVALGPVVVNGCYPDVDGLGHDPDDAAAAAGVTLDAPTAAGLRAAADFRASRLRIQQEQIARLGRELPLPQVRLPFLFTAGIGPSEVGTLADHLAAQLAALSTPGAP